MIVVDLTKVFCTDWVLIDAFSILCGNRHSSLMSCCCWCTVCFTRCLKDKTLKRHLETLRSGLVPVERGDLHLLYLIWTIIIKKKVPSLYRIHPCACPGCVRWACAHMECVQSHRCWNLATTPRRQDEGWIWSFSTSGVKCVCFSRYQTLIKELSSCLVRFMILLIYFEILRFLNNKRGRFFLCITVSCERTYPPGLGCSSVTVLKTLLLCSAVWFLQQPGSSSILDVKMWNWCFLSSHLIKSRRTERFVM